ncbi:MAG TPA: hypothetical protein ENN09_04845 [Planctomycetes bacterium]|nr:hypothetical protein [Planctomycetota bacterium]
MSAASIQTDGRPAFIDVHVHVRARHCGILRGGRQPYATPDELLARYDEIGVEKAILLPAASPECQYVPQTVHEVIDICERYPERFVPFCNVDPRALTNSPDAPLDELLAHYKDLGCRGVGEVTANLRFDDPLVLNLFARCEKLALPLTFHVAPAVGGCYGLYDDPGLPLLEAALKRFPTLVFLGHSQPFWAEISPLDTPDDRKGYPKGPVKDGGRTLELFRRYPNLHGDLSAMSGFNAVSRDEAFGACFLADFQDRLHFGTDITAPDTPTPLPAFLAKLRNENKITEDCFNKIARDNSVKLLGL